MMIEPKDINKLSSILFEILDKSNQKEQTPDERRVEYAIRAISELPEGNYANTYRNAPIKDLPAQSVLRLCGYLMSREIDRQNTDFGSW